MNEETLKKNIEWYKTTWGKNKTIPSQFEAPILFALSHYPELKEVKIRFHITGSAMFPYASRPVWQTMFRSRNEREYIVVIANNSLDPDMEKILLRKLIFNLQVGILGHELAHIVDYIKKSAAEIAAIGLLYFIPSYRAKFEKNTDRRTVDYGLGLYLYEFESYVRSLPGLIKRNGWIHKYYLDPEEIFEYMKRVNS